MRRRITLSILGTVAAALLLAGLGTLALTRFDARSSARSDLEAQAQATSAILDIRSIPQRDAQGNRISVKERLTRIRELLDGVWGVDWIGDERTVDVHVRQLRKKLGDGFPLSTVWGVGYRLD